jgi:SAM-dependent methyltransferase
MTPAGTPLACPVCRALLPRFFVRLDECDYWRCDACEATFLDPRRRPGRQEEHACYLLHENDPHDPGYRRFLSRLAVPLLAGLDSGSRGLDYGCGPGPALAAMLREAGHDIALYDPFFHPDPAPLADTYDFITCTEAVEHFHYPADEFDRLDRMLRPGGRLAVMTCFQTDDTRFARWHYRQDPTHVVFYREATLHAIAAQRGWTCEIPAKDVALMRKDLPVKPSSRRPGPASGRPKRRLQSGPRASDNAPRRAAPGPRFSPG